MCSFLTPAHTVAHYQPLRQLHSDFGHSGMGPVVSEVHCSIQRKILLLRSLRLNSDSESCNRANLHDLHVGDGEGKGWGDSHNVNQNHYVDKPGHFVYRTPVFMLAVKEKPNDVRSTSSQHIYQKGKRRGEANERLTR